MRRPYHVCGGLQDNGSWCGPSAVRSGNGAVNTDWYNVGGGDGFYTRNDPTDYTIIYSESQNGNVNRRQPARRIDAQHPSVARRRWWRRGRWRGRRQHHQSAAEVRRLPVQLERADRALAAQPGDDLLRRAVLLQVDEPRRHVVDESDRSHEERRSLREPDHGRGRPRADGVEARRLREQLEHHDHPRVAGAARRHLGGHRRRQRARQPERRRDVHERLRQHHRRAEDRIADRAHRAVELRSGHGVRRDRQPSLRRLEAVSLQDDGLRQDVDVGRGQPAGEGPHQRGRGGLRQSEPASSSARSSACSSRSTAERTGSRS